MSSFLGEIQSIWLFLILKYFNDIPYIRNSNLISLKDKLYYILNNNTDNKKVYFYIALISFKYQASIFVEEIEKVKADTLQKKILDIYQVKVEKDPNWPLELIKTIKTLMPWDEFKEKYGDSFLGEKLIPLEKEEVG